DGGCVFPRGARRTRFDEAAHGVIVVRDHELRRGKIIFHSRRVIVGKPHNSERRHGIAAARLAFGNETAKFGEPFAKARIAAAMQIGVVLSYGGIGSGGWIERGLVAIGGHAVRRGNGKAAKTPSVMFVERSVSGDGAHG